MGHFKVDSNSFGYKVDSNSFGYKVDSNLNKQGRMYYLVKKAWRRELVPPYKNESCSHVDLDSTIFIYLSRLGFYLILEEIARKK